MPFVILCLLFNREEMLCSEYVDTKYNFKITIPDTWEKKSKDNFPYISGSFIVGWKKKDRNAVLIISSQSPGKKIHLQDLIFGISDTLKNKMKADIKIEEITHFNLFSCLLISAVGLGDGKSLGQGKILTQASWSIFPKDNDLVVFYVSSPQNYYQEIMTDFYSILFSKENILTK